MMKKLKVCLAILLTLAMVLGMCACGGNDNNANNANNTNTTNNDQNTNQTDSNTQDDGEVLTLKLGGTVAEEHPITLAEYKFAELAEEKSGGKIIIEVYPNCQLGAAREMFEAVQMGNLDIVESGSMVLGNFTDTIKFTNLPFLFNGRDAAVAWKETDENRELMQSIADETGLYEFGYVEGGAFQIETSNKLIKTPSDLTNMKFRSQEADCFMQTLSTLGANPTAMAFSELYTALQQGVVEGMINSLVTVQTGGFDEVTPKITVINLFYDMTGMYINYDLWQTLSAEQQNILVEAMAEATQYQFELLDAQDSEVVAALEQTCEIYYPTDAEMETWKEAAQPVYDWFKQTYDIPNVDDYFAVIEECNNANP